MPLTEFARVQLLPPFTPTTPTTLHTLSLALHHLRTATSHPFHIFRSLSNPSILFLFGQWESLSHHETFIASAENQADLAALEGKLEVLSLMHVDVELDTLRLGERGRVWVGRGGSADEGWCRVVDRERVWVKWANSEEEEGEWEEVEDFGSVVAEAGSA
jgi:quinol monooxygenase YgiN